MKTNQERIKKDIEELSKYNLTPDGGLTRLTYTKEDRGAREYIKGQMELAGLKVFEDPVGTIVGRLDGKLKDVPSIMIGSHYDSVKNGGNFDGVAGVVAAIEIARVIKENDIKVNYPLEFVAMIEEEGTRFKAGFLSSRAMVGSVSREELENCKDSDGISIAKAMRDFGFNPDMIKKAAREVGEIKAFIELHIEQGPVLENNKKEIGIVESIVGITQFEIIVKGRPDHAGTTPMNMRVDALDAAVQVISKISRFAKNIGEGTVATVGMLELLPGAVNVVPGEVKFTVDIRSKEKKCIEAVGSFIISELDKICQEKCVRYTLNKLVTVEPVKLSNKIIDLLNRSCDNLDFTKQLMLSGAGHDAMVMTEITDVGMIFVPSKNGRSHCPEEWTDYEDLQKGIEVAYRTVLDIAEDR